MKERMVPAQQLSDAGEDLVRLAAAKDAEIARLRNTIGWEASVAYRAEIARLTEKLDAATATFDDEQAAHQDTLRLWRRRGTYIAALTGAMKALREAVVVLTDFDADQEDREAVAGRCRTALDAEAAAETEGT